MQVGILGFGIVGKSYLKFFKNNNIHIWDSRSLSSCELFQINSLRGKFVGDLPLEQFLEFNDKIYLSPGFDVRPHAKYKNKFVCELDLFSQQFNGKSLGVTGTLGKTSITRALGELLGFSIGGNIGKPMLDLVEEKSVCLELSSFQLEESYLFSPDIAIISNIYQNHIDRHGNIDAYLNAKLNLLVNQNENQYSILPIELLNKVSNYKGKQYFLSTKPIGALLVDNLFYVRDGCFFFQEHMICRIDQIPQVTFLENMLFICAVLFLEGYDVIKKVADMVNSKADPHRLELVGTGKGVDFYNDSKATVMEATLAAIEKLSLASRPIILIIGGISKGVDRSCFVKELLRYTNIKKILCFGKECDLLEGCEIHSTLKEVVAASINITQEGDIVLFSPGGASFDLFNNFVERGNHYKKLLESYINEEQFHKAKSTISIING